MWRFVLSRRWWAGHVLIAAGCLLFLVLARWQWDRSQSITGDWQNLGYALQWPLFAVFLVIAWLRFLWLERHRDWLERHRDPAAAPSPVPGSTATQAWEPARPGPPRPIPKDDPDDELAAYNAYLARLADEDRRR